MVAPASATPSKAILSAARLLERSASDPPRPTIVNPSFAMSVLSLSYSGQNPTSPKGANACYAATLFRTLSSDNQPLAAAMSSSPSSCPPRCQVKDTSAPPLSKIATSSSGWSRGTIGS